jgi:hypothetical protein
LHLHLNKIKFIRTTMFASPSVTRFIINAIDVIACAKHLNYGVGGASSSSKTV